MDSNETNRPLTEAQVETTTEALVVSSTEPKESNVPATSFQTKEEIIERLTEISNQEDSIDKSELDSLKQTFYRLHNAEIEVARKTFEENGGNPEEFIPQKDEAEVQFKDIMSTIKEKRNALKAEEEQEKLENLEKKQAIIERMKELTESSEDANKSYTEFKKLQTEWNEIKNIPATKVNEIWKSYQLYTEKFYDLLKLNNEFREYDFKKNLEIKIHLCETAEKLAGEEDVISAFHQLQKLHQEFRETGPVAKEQRDEIWTRFKTASTIVNRRHQQHFEEIKEREQRNLDEKTVICEIVEAMEYDKMQTFQDWHNKTEEVLALQAKWKTIGFAPQKMNTKIFERFRAACDDFFRRKTEHFKSLKGSMNENLERKKQMCEKAEALKNSTDWKTTAETLAKLQKEWKEVGPVAKKYSESIWKRFVTACDYFYEQKNKAESSHKVTELENLNKKKAIIEKLTEINNAEAETNADAVRALVKEWNAIGHVPYKDKDRIYKQYRTLVDALFNKLNLSASQKKLKNFKSSISSKENNIYREREKLVRAYENMKNEIQTYENNLGFLNSASKKGNSLVQEMNRKVEKLKADLELIQQKIAVIDESINSES
ncbi:MAG: DUF349 domain-containing protein [Bacteroidaceae bacterium]|nr:DUF349 domain-containing protein [Bacteroidaceae bacterium]